MKYSVTLYIEKKLTWGSYAELLPLLLDLDANEDANEDEDEDGDEDEDELEFPPTFSTKREPSEV